MNDIGPGFPGCVGIIDRPPPGGVGTVTAAAADAELDAVAAAVDVDAI